MQIIWKYNKNEQSIEANKKIYYKMLNKKYWTENWIKHINKKKKKQDMFEYNDRIFTADNLLALKILLKNLLLSV